MRKCNYDKPQSVILTLKQACLKTLRHTLMRLTEGLPDSAEHCFQVTIHPCQSYNTDTRLLSATFAYFIPARIYMGGR